MSSSNQKPTVFIHAKRNAWLPAKVSAYSLKRASRQPDSFDIRTLFYEDFPELMEYHGQPYARTQSMIVRWNSTDPQAFVPLRFAVPKLMNYQSRAIIMDADIFAVGDIYELLSRDMNGASIMCKKLPSQKRRNKADKEGHFVSSVMLLECAKLNHWKWEENLKDFFSELDQKKKNYQRWINLEFEPKGTVIPFEETWNSYDTLNHETKLLHNTNRITQPWMTGLPYDRVPRPNEKKAFNLIPKRYLNGLKFLITEGRYLPYGRYMQHPDPLQIQFFFYLLKNALIDGFIQENEIHQAINSKEIRPDVFELLDKVDEQSLPEYLKAPVELEKST